MTGVVVYVVATLKGGVRKTTSTLFIAWAWAARGEKVLVIDADAYTQGVTDWITDIWNETGGEGLTFDVAQWSPRLGLLVPFIREHVARTGATRVIIDVGGEAPEVLAQGAQMAKATGGRVISPVGAEHAEVRRLGATREVVTQNGAEMVVLLTRVPSVGKGAAARVRHALTGAGFQVLPTEVERNVARYMEVWGTVPTDLGAYAGVGNDLLPVAA